MELQEQQECYRLKLSLKVFKVLILERKKKEKRKIFPWTFVPTEQKKKNNPVTNKCNLLRMQLQNGETF